MLGRPSLSVPRHRVRGVRLGMTKTQPENPDSDRSDHSLAADVLLRQEPAEEEDEEEEEDDGKEDDDNEGDDDGYSERARQADHCIFQAG